MSRALPLNDPSAAVAEPTGVPETLTGTVAVYDPAMCCPTGLCGPSVEPALLAVSRDLRWLEKKGATVTRFGLAQQPDAFVSTPRVAGLMQAFGDTALPAVLVNGDVLCYGRYPSRDEIVAALSPRTQTTKAAPVPCCTPGSGCC